MFDNLEEGIGQIFEIIQVMEELVTSPNSKVIITGSGGNVPMIINE